MVATVLEKTVAEDCDDTSIYTYYCLRIEDVLKGNVGKTRFVLRVPGGELPEQGIGLVVPGMPVMATGRRYLLFGLASPKNGLSPTGVWQGVYLFESHPADATRVLVDSAGRMITGLANGDFVRTARPLTKCPGDFVPIHGELGCGWTTGEPGLPTIDWPDTDPSQDPVFLHPQPSESVSRAAWQAYVDRVPVG